MRPCRQLNHFASRTVSVFAVVLLQFMVAHAYTVIMHGGRRIEIPSSFVVTPATLTYEVTGGIQITIAMAAIDISATEKANQEQPGSLLGRAKWGVPALSIARKGIGEETAIQSGRRTITNRDLETLARRRQESERTYEDRRKRLGLPSLEESRKRAAADFDLVTTELSRKRIAEKEVEDSWRLRAASLRTEIAALDAELDYIRARLDEGPPLGALRGSFASVGAAVSFRSFSGGRNLGGRPLGIVGGGRSVRERMTSPLNVFDAARYGTQLRARVRFGEVTRGQISVGPLNSRNSRRMGAGVPFPRNGPPVRVANVLVSGSPLQDYDFSYERGALITRFNELAVDRAGLKARWRELEDEARRAGVPPGWLRP